MTEHGFRLDTVYKRSSIHDQYGGNRQGGISAPAKYPFIFIFSGKSGQLHGYKDQWENSDVFSYTGEGQINDMQFTRGNLLLRDHIKLGRRIFLFTEDNRSFVKFNGELELSDVDYFLGLDRNGKERIAIKFFLKRKGKFLEYARHVATAPPLQDPRAEVLRNIPSVTERQGLITSRVGQGAYRKSILYRWKFKCAVTEYSKNEILIASHIVPWKDATNDERLDVNNGILLSPVYDALFDRNLISFENDGRIILSDSIKHSNYRILGVSGEEKIKHFSNDNHLYLERHRELLSNS